MTKERKPNSVPRPFSVYLDKVKEHIPDGYEWYDLVEEYTNAKDTRFKLKCDKGHTSTIFSLDTLRLGVKCHECTGRLRWTKERIDYALKTICGKYTLIDIPKGYTGQMTELLMHCPDCNKNFTKKFIYLYQGHGCLCVKGKRWNSEELLTEMRNNQKDHEVIGYVSDYKDFYERNILVKCPNGHEYTASGHSFLVNGSRCKLCSGKNKKSTEQVVKEITDKAIDKGDTFVDFVGGEYRGMLKTRLVMRCSSGHEFTPNLGDYVSKNSGCPMCSNHGFKRNKPAYIYVQTLYKEDVAVAIKFGITNNRLIKRIQNQSSKSTFRHELTFYKKYDNGDDALSMECAIKKKYKGFYVSKEDMPDGYTETLSISELQNVIDMINS